MQKRKFFYWLTISNFLYIVILLILAGVSINLVLGPNGLISKAQEAALKTDKATLDEKIQMAIVSAQMENNEYKELTAENLGSALIKDGTKAIVSENEDGTIHILFLDEKKEYRLNSDGNIEDLNIDFDTKYVAPASQDEERNDGVIGIGTDGQPVDMDLWEYRLLDDGTYALNDEESVEAVIGGTAGYKGKIVDGKIQGTVPQYIKDISDEEFKPVTSLIYLFVSMNLLEAPKIPDTVTNMYATFNNTKITKMPIIPNGVTNMYGTFANCTTLTETYTIPDSVTNMYGTFNSCMSLINAPKIPDSVTNMGLTFKNCISLTIAPKIPVRVTNMHNTFYGCTLLKTAPEIPQGVTDMYATFYGCTSLTTAPKIPNSVTILISTFNGCINLQGIIEIDANVKGEQLGEEYYNHIDYDNCLLNATTSPGLTLKVTGTCAMLQEIVENANNTNITLK